LAIETLLSAYHPIRGCLYEEAQVLTTVLEHYTVKKVCPFFPSPAGMSLIRLSLDGNNLIIPAQGEFG